MKKLSTFDIKDEQVVSLLSFFRKNHQNMQKNWPMYTNVQKQFQNIAKMLNMSMVTLINNAHGSIYQKIQSIETIIKQIAMKHNIQKKYQQKQKYKQNLNLNQNQNQNQNQSYNINSSRYFEQQYKTPNKRNIKIKNITKMTEMRSVKGAELLQKKKDFRKCPHCSSQYKQNLQLDLVRDNRQYQQQKLKSKSKSKSKSKYKQKKKQSQIYLQKKQQIKYIEKRTNLDDQNGMSDNNYYQNDELYQSSIGPKFQESNNSILKKNDFYLDQENKQKKQKRQKCLNQEDYKPIKLKKIQENQEQKIQKQQYYQQIRLQKLTFKISSLLSLDQKKLIQERLLKTGVKYTYKSELLFKYSYHSFSKNFHRYVDHKKNVLLIVKLVNKKIVCGFSEISFQKRNIPQENYRAFICDVTRKKFYQPKNPCKTICYDQNFIIFGNSEIRLKIKDYKMYSNFGISKSFFNPNGDQVGDFIGKQGLISKRQAEIQDYEIYSLS